VALDKGQIQILIKAKDEASKNLGNINCRFGLMSKLCIMAGIAMVAVGTAITAVVGKSLKAFAAAGDEIQKMALRTGIATETLSEMKHVLEISGADLSLMETATRRISKSIVDANEVMATYIRAYERIGLSVDDLMKMKPEEQFMTIALAIADLEDHTIKAATAQDIFGRAGTKMLPMLAAGADGIQELREEAHKLGIVFDQEAADKAAELTDAIHRMGEAVSGLKYQLGEALAPAVSNIADKITGVVAGMHEWGEEHPALYSKMVTMGSAAGLLMIPLGTILIMLPMLARGFTMVKHGMHGAMVGMTRLATAARMTTMQMGMLAAGISMVIMGIIMLKQHQAAQAEALKTQEERQAKMKELLAKWSV